MNRPANRGPPDTPRETLTPNKGICTLPRRMPRIAVSAKAARPNESSFSQGSFLALSTASSGGGRVFTARGSALNRRGAICTKSTVPTTPKG